MTGLARLAGAVVLLAVLWTGTVAGVDRGSREADERRADDRIEVAKAFAASVNDWLDQGLLEAARLARTVGTGRGPAANEAVNAFVSQPNVFTRSAMIFSGSSVTSASAQHALLVDVPLRPCVRTDDDGGAVADTRLTEVVARAASTQQVVVSPILEIPGQCEATVAVAAQAGAGVAVVVGDLDEARSRLRAASLITEPDIGAPAVGREVAPGGTRVLLVTGDTALDPGTDSDRITTPPDVADFVAGFRADGPSRSRYALGDGNAEVLAAAARVSPVTDEWTVVLEQDAAVFDIELQSRPAVVVASILTVVFAVVFGLILYFDVRRSRERRRTDAAKNAFFSIAGHELRTPLTSIKGFAETLSDNWEALGDDRRQQLVGRMVPQARRLDRLVERLLVAASIQAETHVRAQVRDIDPLAVMQAVAEQFRAEAPLHTFTVRQVGDAGEVHADPRALDQVLQHLVDNAVKYSPGGGEIRLRVGRRDGLVHILVEDHGIGLPADHRHIFERFVQGESVTTRAHDEGGVGLGLFIVRTLVEDMGGTVRAESWGSGGARFIVSLRPAEGRNAKRRLRFRDERPGPNGSVRTTDEVGARSD